MTLHMFTLNGLCTIDMRWEGNLHAFSYHTLTNEAFYFMIGITISFTVTETVANETLQDTCENASS
jgi:hypothetical protein